MAYKSIEQRREYDRQWAKNNSARRQELNAAWQRKREEWYREFKKTLSCLKCGEDHISCLQFHHRNGDDKLGAIANLAPKWSEKKLMTEISKCDVLCANCHAKHHYDERTG